VHGTLHEDTVSRYISVSSFADVDVTLTDVINKIHKFQLTFSFVFYWCSYCTYICLPFTQWFGEKKVVYIKLLNVLILAQIIHWVIQSKRRKATTVHTDTSSRHFVRAGNSRRT